MSLNSEYIENQPLLTPRAHSRPVSTYWLMIFGSFAFLVISAIFFAFSITVFEMFDHSARERRVVVICVDGMRFDTIDRLSTSSGDFPTFKRLIAEGVRAKHMSSQFPTTSLVNKWVSATGFCPNMTGMIGDTMYDASLGLFDSKKNDSRWWGGEPIWISAEKSDKKTFVSFPGDIISFGGVVPTYSRPITGENSIESMFKQMTGNFATSRNTWPALSMISIDSVRNASIGFGVFSPQVKEAVKTIDHFLGRFVEDLKTLNMTDPLDIIIIGDSGMNMAFKRLDIDSLVPEILLRSDIVEFMSLDNSYSVNVNIRPKSESDTPILLESLSRVEGISCYTKDKIPPRYLLTNSTRIASIFCMSHSGYYISLSTRNVPQFHAISGYDNLNFEMSSTFIAHGNMFKKGIEIKGFPNTDVYNLLAYALNLDYIKNNSTELLIEEIVDLF